MATNKKVQRRTRIKQSIRRKIFGTADRPRLSVFRSNRSIYAQIIDDEASITIVSASSLEFGDKKTANVEISKEVGKLLASKAKEKNLEAVIFDRNGYLYHGNVKALAEGAREGGLKF
ncbi:MAG: 50S ribosomal protein L18 [Microscillaceae bacterium]|nr:50S ribosomal protein L18 [Microscillaceae bacterium]